MGNSRDEIQERISKSEIQTVNSSKCSLSWLKGKLATTEIDFYEEKRVRNENIRDEMNIGRRRRNRKAHS